MKANVGALDAATRWVLAVLLFIVAVSVSSMFWSMIAAVGAFIMAGTAFSHRCPLYSLLGINTCPPGPVAGAR
jgi:hypothetical protein